MANKICEHKPYGITGKEPVAFGTCFECGKVVPWPILLGRHLTRIEMKIDALVRTLVPALAQEELDRINVNAAYPEYPKVESNGKA